MVGCGLKADFWKEKRILVTGGEGFLGSHVIELLKEMGVSEENIRVPIYPENDLKRWETCIKFVKDIEIVIHLAANVGGIGYNQKYPGSIFYDNAIMGIQMMEAARQENVKKFLAVGTILAYPKSTPVPFKEENLWNGYPEETNVGYGLGKKMMLVQAQAYRQQYGFNSIFLMPVNLYGPGDNFDPRSSHVFSALIRKVFDAVDAGEDFITVWGTGKATREFLYVEDAAEGILLATERYNKPDPINLGSGVETSIKELVKLIVEVIGFSGEVKWDISKPDGQLRIYSDTNKAKEEFGFEAKTDLKSGLKKTIEWYKDQYKRKI